MAIYHFSAKIISRANGSSALAAAAYRSASRLHDQRLDRHHDFSNKAGVVHSEVMLPDGAPERLGDRASLWNAVESAELRKDAQLAREVEFAIPRELDQAEGIRLAREFVQTEFVDRGMIADLNVHIDSNADGPKPHAHVMLTTRSVGEDGFGAKVRDWNRTDLLERWREAWAEHANRRLAERDIDARIDHRSLAAQGIDLEPQHKIGPAAARMATQGRQSERLVEHQAIARANGDRLLADPGIALDAITRQQTTFTRRDLAMFVHRHSEGKDQFDRILATIHASPEIVALGKDGRGEARFTSRAMLATEQRLAQATVRLDADRRHAVGEPHRAAALARAERRGMLLSPEQRSAFDHVTQARGIGVVIGYAGTGKSAMLGVAREAWEQAGYTVRGAALSGIAAETLEQGAGIASRTIASLEHHWNQGRDLLGAQDVLVIDEAGMIGTRQMEGVISEAQKRGAKVVLVGDPEQLQAIEAGAAFRSIAERHGSVEITTIRRQRDDWQRDATRQLATRRTGKAIAAYRAHDAVHAAPTRYHARRVLIDRWDQNRVAHPQASQLILTHTNDEVAALNLAARERLHAAGVLGAEVAVRVEKGERLFAPGDRMMFGRNERSMGVKNGSLGRIESITSTRMAVLLDDGRSVAFDLKDYAALDHGYAATIHKAQGVTVDRVQLLATPGLDRHAAYVALSRHRDRVEVHYGRDDFADEGGLTRTLSRERTKDMASDYARDPSGSPGAFAERRGIGVRSTDRGFQPTAEPARSLPLIPEPGVAHDHASAALDPAVARHGRIVRAMLFARSVGDEPSPDQRSELRASRAALDAIRPHAARDLETAFANDRDLASQTANGRTAAAIRAMQLEAELRVDPQRRADMFVQRWQALAQQRRLLLRDREDSRAGKVADRMLGMAKGLERDPQVESILRIRRQQLGLGAASTGGTGVGRELGDMVGRWRGRGLGIGM